MKQFNSFGNFGTILILSLLEHTFDRIRIMDNAVSLLAENGVLELITPSVWPLHNFPFDTWRIMPNLYEEYSKRRKLAVVSDTFVFTGFGPVDSFRNSDLTYSFPSPASSKHAFRYGRLIHRVFNTFGRNAVLPSYVSVAIVLRRM